MGTWIGESELQFKVRRLEAAFLSKECLSHTLKVREPWGYLRIRSFER